MPLVEHVVKVRTKSLVSIAYVMASVQFKMTHLECNFDELVPEIIFI